jgi:hypothetical protein
MGCAIIEFGDGYGWIRGTGVKACSVPGCNRLSEYLCDFPIARGRTCDARLCSRHARLQSRASTEALPGLADVITRDDETRIDYCPTHDAFHDALTRSRSLI